MSTSLYGTPPNQDVSSSNSTSLYGGAATPIPDSSGNLVVRGDLIVLSGNILTTATTGNIFPTNATTINFGGSATTVNIGAGTGTTTINNNLTVGGTLTGPGADFGNITIAIADDNTITTTTGNLKLGAATNTVEVLNDLTTGGDISVGDDLTVVGNNVNLAQATVIGYSENNSRLNRLNIRSTTGNTSGLRVQGPNTSTSSNSFVTAYSTSDLNNGRSINLNARADALANPYRITINSTTGGIVGNANGVLGFYDNATLISTINPAGILQSTDLTTKAYVDAHPGTTYDIDATTTTGGANLNLNGSDSTTDTVKFAGGTNVTVTRTTANEITISSVDTDTKYNIDASSTTGGANFNLTGSDSTTDTVKFASGTNVTVAQTSANEITISSVDTDTKYNIDASSTTGGANLNLTGSDSTTDTVKFANGTGVTVSQINANEMSIAIGQSVATTDNVIFDTVQATTSISTDNIFSITSPLAITSNQSGGGLVQITADDTSPGSDLGVLSIDPTALTWTHTAGILVPGSVSGTWSYNINGTTSFPNYTFPYADGAANQVLKTNGSGTVTWQNDIDTNTTYTIDASSTTGGANLNLVGSDSTTDTVKFASGTGVTVSQVNANEMSIAIGQAVGTGDSPSFAGVTAGNITVGVATDNTIASTNVNGDILIVPNGTGDVDLVADTVQIGDANATATLTTNGTGDLVLNTNNGTNAGTITLTQGTNGNIALAPNGTGIVTVSTATDTNITDANYITGLIWATRNTAFSIPTTSLTTLSGTNGFQAVSSAGGANGYAAMMGITHYQSDTNAGVNASPTFTFRNALGTNSAPAAVPTNNVIMSINGDAYATTNFANVIATTGSGGGTSSISPIQMQFYARETFADSAGTVTNAGCGFRVRGFQTATAMSVANRISFIDHQPTTATYRANTFNIQPSTSTANYMQLSTASGNINQDTLTIRNNAGTENRMLIESTGTTARRTVTGTPGVAENRPTFILDLSRTDQATPNNNDGNSFRQRVRGSNNTFYTISDINATYSTVGNNRFSINLANGDQTTGTFSSLNTFSSSITETIISAGTASATPGASTVSNILTVNKDRVITARPLQINGSTSGSIEFSAGATPAVQTYVLPQAYPTVNNQVLVSDTTGTMSWVNTSSLAANYLDANWTTAIGTLTANTIYGIPLTSLSATNITIATGAIAIDNATATGPTRITFSQTGRYNLQFSVQLANADTAEQDFDLWLRKNTADVADSNTQLTVPKQQGGIPGKNVMALNLLLNVTSVGDYYELVYAVTDPDCKPEVIAAITTPYTRPRAPAIIVTVVPVGA